MTTEGKIARRQLSLLELAADLGNVSKACKLVGCSRQQLALCQFDATVFPAPTGRQAASGTSRRLVAG